MELELANKVMQVGLDCGATFVELFVEETRDSSLLFKDQKVESAAAGTEFGIGVRLLYGTQVLYAHTSSEKEDDIISIIKKLALAAPSMEQKTQGDFANSLVKVNQLHPVELDPRQSGQAYKLDFLKEADSWCRKESDKINQVSVSVSDAVSTIRIFNTEGLALEDFRTRTRFSLNVTAANGNDRIGSHAAPGALRGYEFLNTLDIKELSQDTAQRALKMLTAGYISGGQIPVVMGNGFGGVIFHEACGHPLETESIRRKASPFCDKLGEKIAHESVTAIDDGTFTNEWGSLNIDDEGMPVQKTTLIENGILKSYMSDRVGATEVDVPRTGSARRESYKYAPVSRMRNTYIAEGKSSVEDMIGSIDEGLYAPKMGGGSVNPATGEFNFSVEEGYHIKNGKITEPVRGATLIGKGHEVLPKISMVGNDLKLAAGMCGASSGSVPVTVGQPSLKVESILVGGR
jgi:TldD protein